MASLVNKRLLIVLFFVLFFISFQATARTLKERSTSGVKDETINGGGHDDNQTSKPKETNEANNNNDDDAEGEVFSMDYTPASKKPPIHN